MFELTIFNKKSSKDENLVAWDQILDSNRYNAQILYSKQKFKIKEGSAKAILDEDIKKLNEFLKENSKLKVFFESLNDASIDIELRNHFHHLVLYDSKNRLLIIDSNLDPALYSVYLFSFYYVLSRPYKTANQIFNNFVDFFLALEFKNREELKNFFYSRSDLDVEDYFLNFLNQIEIFQNLSNKEKFKEVQVLRNRTLVGKLPWSIAELENIKRKHLDSSEGIFSNNAILDFFEVLKSSYVKDSNYYKALAKVIKILGLDFVAQRGSRVAHEQAPILINSKKCFIDNFSNNDLESNLKEFKSKLEKFKNDFLVNKPFIFNTKTFIQVDMCLSELIFLVSSRSFDKSKFNKFFSILKNSLFEFFNSFENLFRNEKKFFNDYYQDFSSSKKFLIELLLEINESFNALFSIETHSVIMIQRLSLRSGHMIARILLGDNLYIETDLESEEHRLNAIPFTFVAPDLDCVAPYIDAFFENASISIFSDKETSKPEIKWSNAEDLAYSLAPALFKAIKSKNQSGSMFLYQLETTLFGPLIDLYMFLLESELSAIASIDSYPDLLNDLKHRLISNEEKILSACDFVFKYYLYEDDLYDLMLLENLNKKEAAFQIIQSNSDILKDIYAYLSILEANPEALYTILDKYKDFYTDISYSSEIKYESLANSISQELENTLSSLDSSLILDKNNFLKKFILYPESYFRNQILQENKNLKRSIVSSNKNLNNIDFTFNFSVAPSRIDFGKHVVASVTSLMGRILGANDDESLLQAKKYIDSVSETHNSIFSSAFEAGSVKVIENTCRALQYAKTISFQGLFQEFDIDGNLARACINSRNSKEAGHHLMEFGTMASTGYCITKEPLFIILALSYDSENLLDKLGIFNHGHREELKSFYKNLLSKRNDFLNKKDWFLYANEEIYSSDLIKKYLLDSEYPLLINPNALISLFDYLSEKSNPDALVIRNYSKFLSNLVEQARITNETGIIQRIHIMNSAIKNANQYLKSNKSYSDLNIVFNASYKGNVSDERENANQYLIAILLHEMKFIKNISNPTIYDLLIYQTENHSLPNLIKIFDPYVDPDTFMGGELKQISETTLFKLSSISNYLNSPMNIEQFKAMILSYGSNPNNWRYFNRLLSDIPEENKSKVLSELENLKSQIKYLEIYLNGFYKDPDLAYQSVDVVHLNSDHDELRKSLNNLVYFKNLMKANNPSSLLVLIDNPQQAKYPFMNFIQIQEWLALGGTYSSHMLPASKVEILRSEILKSINWAKEYVKKLFNEFNNDGLDLKQNVNEALLGDFFIYEKKYSDLRKELYIQKFYDAIEINSSEADLLKFKFLIEFYNRLISINDLNDLDFNDWLLLGGRFFLNGVDKSQIEYVFKLFENRNGLKSNRKLLDLFVKSDQDLNLKATNRKILISGSTKESDLLVTEASDTLEFRAKISKNSKLARDRILRFKLHISNNSEILDMSSLIEIFHEKSKSFEDEFLSLSYKNSDDWNLHLSDIQIILYKAFNVFLNSMNFNDFDKKEYLTLIESFIKDKSANFSNLEIFFGDRRSSKGIFHRILRQFNGLNRLEKLNNLIFISELIYYSFLIQLLLDIDDENEIINLLSEFFDQFINVHEEDFPPYLFHRLSCGELFGFDQDYFLNHILREKMFKYSIQLSARIYKILRFSIQKIGILRNSDDNYVLSLLGDFETGFYPAGYIHDPICVEERFWDLMKAIRNLVRNFHDRHPLPLVINSSWEEISKLFYYGISGDTELIWIACLSNIGKHSWDLNSVFRSPELRVENYYEKLDKKYSIVSVITPYLTRDNKINQVYTSFKPDLIKNSNINYMGPFKNNDFKLNDYGFVHALITLDDASELPKPSLTMSAHTHPQYLNFQIPKSGIPEVWSYLSMRQMYSKTELAKILEIANLESLSQIEFYQGEFHSLSSIEEYLRHEIKSKNFNHIDLWILKASKDSGGRGISEALNINYPDDFQKILNFILEKTKTDDLVMQEFVPNNAKSFIKTEFLEEIEETIIESGISYPKILPRENLYFVMRSFQSVSGIKGYLFSVNIGSQTVNAGQGAKLFYGEPIKIMPLYIAGKIQNLLDERGEMILKQAIPKHAEIFARENNIRIINYKGAMKNTFMLNGLFDYIPYVYVKRDSKKFKVFCEDNSTGGLDYYYSFFGKKVLLISKSNHEASILALENLLKDSSNGFLVDRPEEEIDIDLAVIELNSGLGQANLLQKSIEKSYPENKDLFLDWTRDLAYVAINLSS